jgi:YVTN family beta-propeller protein
LLYVTNQSSNTITPISTPGTLLPDVVVGNGPVGVIFGTSGKFAYVTLAGDNAVAVVNVATKSVVATVAVGQAPTRVAVQPKSPFVWATNQNSGSVSVIDTRTNQLATTIPVGSIPVGLAFMPSGQFVYICNAGSNLVSVLNTKSRAIVATIPVATGPVEIAINPAGTVAYVVSQASSTISIIDTATNTVTKTLSGTPFSTPIWVAFTPSGTEAYVTNNATNSVAVIDTTSQTVTTTIPVGNGPTGIAIGTKPPKITSLSKMSTQQYQTITITGTGFGTQQPYTGDSPYISFNDNTRNWQGGYPGNTVTLIVNSWTDSQIVLGGFSGAFAQFGLGIGDHVSVSVINPQSGAGPASKNGIVQ